MENEQWEYHIALLEADARQEQAFLAERWPSVKFPIYASEALIPQ
jgi:hypothetical protein